MKTYIQYIKEIKSLGFSSRLLKKKTRHNNNIILTVCSATSNFNKHALDVLVIIFKMSMQVQLMISTFTNNFMVVKMVNYYYLYKYIYTNLHSFLFYDTSSVAAT